MLNTPPKAFYVRSLSAQQKAKNFFVTLGIFIVADIILAIVLGFGFLATFISLSHSFKSAQTSSASVSKKSAPATTRKNIAPTIEQMPESGDTAPTKGLALLQTGQNYEDASETNKAALYYLSLLNDSSSLTHEELLIAEARYRRLSGSTLSTNASIPENYYQAHSITLVPVDPTSTTIHLDDICKILSSKYLMPCDVLPALTDIAFAVPEINHQLDAPKIIGYINAYLPETLKRDNYVIGITDKDISLDEGNFSFAASNSDLGVAIVSSYRFSTSISELPEYEALLNRRIAIQMMSSLGQLMRFERPTVATCPLAYIDSVDGMANKSSQFCDDENQQLLKFWAPFADQAITRDPETQQTLPTLYSKYFIE